MQYWSWRPLLALSVALVISCGGGSDSTPAGSSPGPAFQVAKLTTVQDVLELPLVRSGDAWYADVRIRLADDGTFVVLSAREVEPSTLPPDATLDPPVAPENLVASAAPVRLTLRRLHLDNEVYHSALFELKGGRWRSVQAPATVRALGTTDLRANTNLFANEDHVVVMNSAPGKSEQFPLRLDTRTYRFCMDAQDEGADSVTLLDPSGNTVLSLRAGGECATLDAQQGLHQVRHTYGGTGSSRTVFLRKKPSAPALGAVQDSAPDEYWGILASLLDRQTHQLVATPLFLALRGFGFGGGCAGDVQGMLQANAVTPGLNPEAPPMTLFETINFFQPVRDASGTPVAIGTPLGCPGANFKLSGFASMGAELDPYIRRFLPKWPDGAFVMTPGFLEQPDGLFPQGSMAPVTASPISVANFSASSTSFGLKSVFAAGRHTPFDGTEAALGRPSPDGSALELWPLEGGQADAFRVEYRAALRYRPSGFPGTSIPANGQVALFNSANCSGPAMVVDQYNLPGMLPGGMGSFNGSVLLGVTTAVTVYERPLYGGASRHLIAAGCIPSASDWKPASLRMQPTTADMVFSTKSCEGCNLSGMNLSGRDLRNAKLAGSNLNNANLSRANLSGADMRQAFLQGAQLPNANLDAANLCGAKLNAAPSTAGSSNVAANLTGAFLRKADLSKSNLAGVNFNDASFFNASQGGCAPSACDSYTRPTCATVAGSTIEGAQFSAAYLVGLDMSNVHGSGAVFSNAVLTGARLSNATLTPLNGTPVSFSGAFIQGTDFTAADLTNATFTNAYDAQSAGCMQFELGVGYTSFPGYAVPASAGSKECTVATAPETACVKFTFTQRTLLPSTVVIGTPAVPMANAAPKNSASCQTAPLCGIPIPNDRVNTCW